MESSETRGLGQEFAGTTFAGSGIFGWRGTRNDPSGCHLGRRPNPREARVARVSGPSELFRVTGDRDLGRARVQWGFPRSSALGWFGAGWPEECGPLWGLWSDGDPSGCRKPWPFGARADGGPVAVRPKGLRPAADRQPNRAGSTGAPLGATAGSRPGLRLSLRGRGECSDRTLRTTLVHFKTAALKAADANCG